MNTESLQLTLSLSGLSQIEADMRRLTTVVSENVGEMSSKISEAFKVLSGGALAGGTLFGFGELAKSFQEVNLQVEKATKTTGAMAQAMAGMAYAANRSDMGIETLQTGLKTFSDWMVRAGQGSRNLRDALLEQARIFQTMPDGAAKTEMAMERFGRAGLNMIQFLDKGPEELSQLFERGQLLTGINDQTVESARAFTDSLTDWKAAAEGLAGSLANTFIPTLTGMLNRMTELIVRFREWRSASAIPGVAAEAAGIGGTFALSAVAARGAMGMMNASLGIGAIASLKDLGAALALLGGRVISLIGPLGLIIASITALGVAVAEFFRMRSAQDNERNTTRTLAEQNESLEASIRKVIDARSKEKVITDEQAVALRNVLDGAKSNSPQDRADVLGFMARRLNQFNPNSQKAPGGRIWTKEELDVANKAIDVERQELDIMRQKTEMANKGAVNGGLNPSILAETGREEDLIYQKRRNAQDALKQDAITQNEFDEIELSIRKELLTVDMKRQGIAADDVRVRRETLTLDLEAMSRQRSLVEQDYSKTAAEKRSGVIALLQQESARIQAEITTLRGLTNKLDATDPRRFVNEAALRELANQKSGADSQLAQARATPDPNSWLAQWTNAMTTLQGRFVSWAAETAKIFVDGMTSAVDTVSANMSRVLLGTEAWKTAMYQIGQSILTGITQNVIKMGLEWVMNLDMMVAKWIVSQFTMAGASTAARQTVMASNVTASTTEAAAAAPNALLHSIETFGVAAIIGAAAFAAAMAASGGFAEGGYTGDGGMYDPAGIVHKGEYVMPASTVQRIGLDRLDAIRAGEGGGNMLTQVNSGDMHFHFHGSEDEMMQHLKNNTGVQNVIVGLMQRNAHKIVPRRA